MKEFLTIRKKIYNFYLDKITDKVFRFYSWKFFPPTINYVMNSKNCEILQPMGKILWLELKEIPDKIKEKFKDNIMIQEKVLTMVKNRNEKYNYRCGLIKLTTGKWKSHIIMDITNYYQTNTLILVHNIKTLWEMKSKFKEFTNIIPAVYWWWKKEIWNITIMTKKSFSLDYKNIQKDFNLVLIDERPVWFSKKFWDTLNIFFANKKWIALYWLSWTPEKLLLDVDDLQKYFGKIIEVKWQENNWYNIIPKFTMYDYSYSGRYLYENPAEMRTAIAENIDRLDLQLKEIDEIFEARNCLLILTDRKQEVENYFEKLSLRDEFVFCMTWDTKEKDDNENIDLAKIFLKWWKVIIIWTIQKCWVWVDIPFIDTIFLASAIKFKSTVIQAIWRALRVYEGKTDVIVWIWNDIPLLKNQRTEKIKAIESEYWVFKKNIEFITIWKQNKIKI